MLRPLESTSGNSTQLRCWVIFPHCVDISFIWFLCKHTQKNQTFQFSSYLEAAIHTSRTLSIMLHFVYLIFLCPSPSHATQESIVVDMVKMVYGWSRVRIIHKNKNFNGFCEHSDPLNSADGPWSLTFMSMLFLTKTPPDHYCIQNKTSHGNHTPWWQWSTCTTLFHKVD